MADFVTLRTEALTLVIDTPTAVTTLMPRFVNRAVTKLQLKHDFKVMEASHPATTLVDQRHLVGNRPSNWKKLRSHRANWIEELGSLHQVTIVSDRFEAITRYGNNPDLDFGSPRLLWEDDENNRFEVFPYPDGNSDFDDGEYRINIPYWKFLPVLSNDTDTNWFTVNAEQWIIYMAVAEAFFANEDEGRAKVWEQRAKREYADVILADKERRLADTETLVPHRGARPPHTQE